MTAKCLKLFNVTILMKRLKKKIFIHQMDMEILCVDVKQIRI
jgi:hypothetical protein